METPATNDSAVQPANQAVIIGDLVTEPEFRELPGGTEAMVFSLTVRQADRAATSVPLIWYDPPRRARAWSVGDQLVMVGSVVRRFFRAGGGTGSRTEVVVVDGERTSRARARKVLGRAASAVRSVEATLA